MLPRRPRVLPAIVLAAAILTPAVTSAGVAIGLDVLGPLTFTNTNAAGPVLFIQDFAGESGLAEIEVLTAFTPMWDFQIMVNSGQFPFLHPAGLNRFLGVVRLDAQNQIRVQLNYPGVNATIRIRQLVRPLGQWPFSEQVGGIVEDISGKSRDGTVDASFAGWFMDGSRLAMRFGPFFNEVNILDEPALNPVKEITLEAIMRPEATHPASPVFLLSKTDGGNTGYALGVTSDNRLWCRVSGNAATNTVTAPAGLSLNDWHHVACVYDGFTLAIYQDNNPVPVASQAHSLDIVAALGDLWIGRDGLFQGSMDETRLFGFALTPAQFLINASPAISTPILPILGAAEIDATPSGLMRGRTLAPGGNGNNAVRRSGRGLRDR